MYGIVDSSEYDKVNDQYNAVIVDEKGNEKEYVTTTELVEGTLIAFVLDSEERVVVKETARPIDFLGCPEVTDVDTDKRTGKLNDSEIIDLDDETVSDQYGEHAIGTVKVGYSDDKEDLGFGGFYFVGFEVSSYEDIKLAKKDFIGEGKEKDIIVIYQLTSVAYNEYEATRG